MPQYIDLVRYRSEHYDALDAYQLSKEQANFTATIGYCIHERKDLRSADKTVVTILSADYPVGFFVLDDGCDKRAVTDNPQAILIRSLSVNPAYQGRGIGRQAMAQLTAFVREIYPDANELVLSVNVRNQAAYRVYLKAGYIDNGKVIEGPMGKQHVLTKEI